MNDRNTDSLGREDQFAQIQGELLEAILSEETLFPWNPADPSTDNYLNVIEGDFNLGDRLESEEILTRSQDFFAGLDRCWEKFPTPTVGLLSSLQAKFGDRVPKNWLNSISTKAQELADAGLSPIDRLVECVKPLLSEWTDDDLQVFARPLAYSMRGTNLEESEVKPWEELSEVERARYTLKIANYALTQALNQADGDRV
ncbi:MAG: hypothetical protein AAGA60_09665 [Cyanobacteria bacterium P01_E01_bin.42]